MKYITFCGDERLTYKHDYNDLHFTEEELSAVCKRWSEEDGINYYIANTNA